MRKDKKILGFGKNLFFTGCVNVFMDVNSEMIYPFVPLFLANTRGAKSHLDSVRVLWPLYGVDRGNSEGVPRHNHPAVFKATAFGVYTTVVGLAMFPASLIGGRLQDHESPSTKFCFGAIMAALSAVLFITFIIVIIRYGSK